MIRSYSALSRYQTIEDRYNYLRLGGTPGYETFGLDRWVNQQFYMSRAWKEVREHVLIRDEGCDLGIAGYEIHNRPVIHHMNPMAVTDIVHGEDHIIDPEFLITTTHKTHNAIHYGDERQLPRPFVERTPGDTKLW